MKNDHAAPVALDRELFAPAVHPDDPLIVEQVAPPRRPLARRPREVAAVQANITHPRADERRLEGPLQVLDFRQFWQRRAVSVVE